MHWPPLLSSSATANNSAVCHYASSPNSLANNSQTKSSRPSLVQDKCIMSKLRLPQLITSLPVNIDLATLLAPERSQTLRQQLDEGTLAYCDFEAKVFRFGPNRNHLTFYPQDLERFAASY